MLYLVNVFIYTAICYLLYLVLPIGVVLAIGALISPGARFADLLASAGLLEPLRAVGIVVALALLLIAQYRAKIAADLYTYSEHGFWQSFTLAGTSTRVFLSFLPVIGRLFGRPDE